MYQDEYGRKWDAKPLHDEAMLLRVKPRALHAALKLQYAQGLTPAPARRFFEKNQCYLFRSEFEWEVVIQYADVLGAWDSWHLYDSLAEYLFMQHRQQADQQERLAIEAIDKAYPPPELAIEAIDKAYPPPELENEVWAVIKKSPYGGLPDPISSMSAPERDWLYHTQEDALEARDAVTQYYGEDYAGVFRCLLRVVSEVKSTKE